ncbi:LON peptidase substrate-binding domain-containing protein [Salinispora arenicola]|uniref:LON peptidase substrate-binding domain-containing protein n=1 Tax=Salinispora arenicola TaxID=168697 RepID=UPI0016B9F8EB|nr:LON peptidase substrate-binding domain-containing protein [Salinispora arenicola]NIL56786.1 LON peptidase substrate-binding domain-containing protein [Salinispora arenicola]NIL60330.1 LON peptidase substrate-binding domain-containing protein [Salinispora arenicola]
MTARLPVFPLGTVLFPGLVLPLHIFEDRYRALVRHLVGLPEGTPREFGVVAIRAGWEVGPTAPDGRPLPGDDVTLHEVGCTAELRQVTELPDGGYDIVTVGRRRFRMGTVDRAGAPYLTAEVEWLPEPDAPDEAAELPAARVIAVFRQYLGLIRADPAEIPEQLPEDPTVLSHLVAATAALTIADRQRLLAIDDTAARLRAELRLLNREAALLRQVRAVPVPLKELAAPPTPN